MGLRRLDLRRRGRARGAVAGPEEKLEITSDLARIPAAPATELDYDHYLEAAGASVIPAAEGFTARTFLIMVRDILDPPLTRS